MQIATVGTFALTVGWVLALLVLIAVAVLLILSMIDTRLGIFLIGLALARLL
jgi:hypothetical protein